MRKSIATLACLQLGVTTAQAQTTGPWATPPPVGSFNIGIEALFLWFNDSPAPVPLVTNTIVGLPNTQTYLGGQDLSTGSMPGFRITGAYALNSNTGLEGNFFYIPERSTTKPVSSSGQVGSINLIVPYFDAVTNTENGTEISLAPQYSGSAQEELKSELLGAELNGTWPLAPTGAWKMDWLAGFRYLRLRDTYTFTTSSPYIPPFTPDIWNTTDEFKATNNFYGAQVGIRARYDQGQFFANGSLKVALGAMVQDVDISGSLVTNDYTNYGPTQTFSGGYFALPTNIGSYSRTVFSVVPEVGLNIGYRITPQASIILGYSFMYASNVVRPGNQINRTVNTTQSTSYAEDPAARLVGPAQPSSQFNDSNFWAQGINVGLSYRF